MTTTARELLSEFEQLAAHDQREVAREILLRTQSWEYPSLTDDELTGIAGEAFRRLDVEEEADEQSRAR